MQDFKIQRVLGEGALSTVFHGVCSISGLSVALKVYHRDKLNSLNVKQVGREIDIHASLTHTNVIKLYAAFEDADGIYLVQEFATGGEKFLILKPQNCIEEGLIREYSTRNYFDWILFSNRY